MNDLAKNSNFTSQLGLTRSAFLIIKHSSSGRREIHDFLFTIETEIKLELGDRIDWQQSVNFDTNKLKTNSSFINLSLEAESSGWLSSTETLKHSRIADFGIEFLISSVFFRRFQTTMNSFMLFNVSTSTLSMISSYRNFPTWDANSATWDWK